jgi:hypothetical protein
MRLLSPRRIYRWLFWDAQWNIGIIRKPISFFIEGFAKPQIKWLQPLDKNRCLADPFATVKDEKLYIFCEETDFGVHNGRIVCLEILNERIVKLTPAIELSVHASYPYIIENKGDTYCVPETYQANEISLYKAEEFPYKWKKAATMVSGFAGVDSTVFRFSGRWWLTSSENTYPWGGWSLGAPQNGLFIWWSKDLEGPWVPHSANPVKRDIASSRPAGTPFVYKGCLYRPSQDCSKVYGGRVVINRVLRLTPTRFEEERAAVIEPDPNGPYPDGLHTISGCGDMTVIDGKCPRSIMTGAVRSGVVGRMKEARKSLISNLTITA